MSNVLFLPYHGIGHLNPSFGLATILQMKGHAVQFAGAEFFHGYATRSGFNYFPLRSVPFGAGFEKWFNGVEKKSNLYWAELKDRYTDRLYHLRAQELLSVLNAFKPEVILLDSTLTTDFIILYPYLKVHRLKLAIVYAMLPTTILPGRPPVNSTVMPEDTEGYKKAVQQVKQHKRIKAWKKKLKFFGMDDDFLIRRRLKKNNIPDTFLSRHLSVLNLALDNITGFIVCPEEFDFPSVEDQALRHYVGFKQLSFNNFHQHNVYLQKKAGIFKRKEEEQLPLVYCSFGTVEPENGQVIVAFLEKLVRIAIDENYLLIVSLGGVEFDKEITGGSHNIHIFKSVSQTEVLSKTDLFISHGGMSSIRESVEAEVPMLMYPVHADYDPRGNAARVAYHRLGLLGDVHVDDKRELLLKMKELLHDPRYKENIRNLKQINAAYTPDRFIKAFDSLSPIL